MRIQLLEILLESELKVLYSVIYGKLSKEEIETRI